MAVCWLAISPTALVAVSNALKLFTINNCHRPELRFNQLTWPVVDNRCPLKRDKIAGRIPPLVALLPPKNCDQRAGVAPRPFSQNEIHVQTRRSQRKLRGAAARSPTARSELERFANLSQYGFCVICFLDLHSAAAKPLQRLRERHCVSAPFVDIGINKNRVFTP
jgi:hypothetical protein